MVAGFREGLKDGAEKDIVGAFCFGLAEFVERVAGDADQEARRSQPPEQAWSGAVGWEVDAVGAGGQGDVNTGVHEDFFVWREEEDLTGERVEMAWGKVFGPELKPIRHRVGPGVFGDLTEDHLLV